MNFQHLPRHFLTIMLLSLILISPVGLAACGNSENNTKIPNYPSVSSSPDVTVEPDPVTITIGNLTDATGPSSNAQAIINMSMYDIIEYYNERDVIKGAKFEIKDYDTRMDDSRYLVGYEWLMENGADFIVTGVPGVAEAIKERADQDKTLVITYPASKDGLEPPGRVFCLGTTFNDEIGFTSLKWIAQNDDEFPTDRPAKIGGTAWNEPYMKSFLSGVKKYCDEYPHQFEWQGAFITDFSFAWDSQIEALKDCDYLIPPQIMYSFVSQFHETGYATKFVGIEAQMAFLNLIDENNKWDSVEGMLFFRTTPWWTDSDPHITFTKNLLMERHPDQYEAIIESGSSYLAVFCHQLLLGLIEETLTEQDDKSELDTESLYDHAQSLSLNIGSAEHTFSDMKRTSANYIKAYETSSELKGVFAADVDQWYPITRLP